MDIEVNDNKQQASFKNGKFYHTFTPSTANQIVKLYHMGCVGDTRLNRIQLEQGTEPTGFVEPKATTNTISGIFKNLRDLDVLMKDPDSDFWTRIKKTARGTVEEYHTNTIKNEIVKTAEGIVETLSKKVDGVTTSVATVSRTVDGINNNITSLEGKVLKKNEISITNNGIQLGSGNKIDGNTIASILSVQPKSIDLISPHIRVTGDMIVDGTIEGKEIKTNTLETGHHKAGSITSEIIAANAVKAKHILIDDGLINNLVTHKAFISKLWAQQAFINKLSTVKISATQLDTDWLSAYTGEIGGFRIGKNPNDGGFWLTGTINFDCGINPGHNAGSRGAQLWAAWGDKWTKAGPNAWWVNAQGVMTCKNTPVFTKGITVHGGVVHYANGTYTYSPNIKKIYMEEENGKTWIRYYVGSVGPKDDELAQYWNYVTMSGSDKRYKSNIKPTEVNGLEIINNLKCYDYDIKLPHEKKKHINCGIMAQDVEMHMNEAHLVYPNGIQSYTPFEMMPYLIKAVQELSIQNNELQQRIIKLEELING